MSKTLIAYFCMEIGVDPAMPTYSGGLGILAGDSIRAAADLGLPMVGVSLLHRKGYFRQHLDMYGNQLEADSDWAPEKLLERLAPRVTVNISGHEVQVQAWRYLVPGESGHTVTVYFLDTAIPENAPWAQSLTHYLYGGDDHYRLCQEVVLGLGGVAMLKALGHDGIQVFHLNEGHASLVTLALLEDKIRQYGSDVLNNGAHEAVRRQCVFTTHTPVASGHDRFTVDLVREVLGGERTNILMSNGCCLDGILNMTNLAMDFSHRINGVSPCHSRLSSSLHPDHDIHCVSNGVHAVTWTSLPFCRLYDRYIPEWRRDNYHLRYAVNIPQEDIWHAHMEAKQAMLREMEQRTGVRLDPSVMTLGLARRATPYKRMDLLFSDLTRLGHIARRVGPLQIICGGKAHPRDEGGKVLIRRIFEAASALKNIIPIIFLENYDMTSGKYLCSGVDIWLNTPQKPLEASGTSGMKAALNGVPSLSSLDGWWIDGCIEGVTGWSVEDNYQAEVNPDIELASLYDKLEYVILPMFYGQQRKFASVMRSAIAINGSYFNAQRMVTQYVENSYFINGNSQVNLHNKYSETDLASQHRSIT